jgi:hypothetical protein
MELKQKSEKIKIKFKDYLHLIFHSAKDNHFRIQQCHQNPDGEVKCDIYFDSYIALKNYQKKVRRVTLSLSSAISVIVISTLVIQLILPVFKSQAATFNWQQNSWVGGAFPNDYVTHQETPVSNWNKYASKDANITADGDGVNLSSETVSWTQTTDTDFNVGTASQTAVSGSGNDALVQLDTVATNYSVVQTDNTSTVANPGTQGGWGYGTFSITEQSGSGDGTSVQLTTADGKTTLYRGAGTGGSSISRTNTNNICLNSTYKPNCSTGSTKAFISINNGLGTDEIRDMQTSDVDSDGATGIFNSSSPIYGYHKGNGTFTAITNSWAEMFDGSIPVALNTALQYADLNWWSQSDIYGALHASDFCPGTYGRIGNVGFINNTWITSGRTTCGSTQEDVLCICYAVSYNSSGTYVSYVNGGDNVSSRIWNSFAWNETLSGGDISVKVKSGSSALTPPSFDADTCDGSASPIALNPTCANANDTYLWYQATLTGPGTATPTLDQVSVDVDVNNYQATGTYASPIYDTLGSISFGNLTYSSDITPVGSSVAVKVRTSNNADMSGADDWSSCVAISSGSDISGNGCVADGEQYVQYQATLTSSTDQTQTPTLNDTIIGFERIAGFSGSPVSQTLTGSWYNADDETNVLTGIIWEEEETLPSGTSVKFQVQTAPTNTGDDAPETGSATGFVGPDGTGSTYFQSSDATNCSATVDVGIRTVNCSIPAEINIGDGADDQWMQYKIILGTDNGSRTATVTRAELQYVVNIAPLVGSVTASQDASGIVNISYDIADSDTATQTISVLADLGVSLDEDLAVDDAVAITVSNTASLPSSGTIQIEREQISYSGKSGNDLTGIIRGVNSSRATSHLSSETIWYKSSVSTVAGDVGADVANGNGKEVTWTIKTDLPGVYYETARIMVSANDGNAANQVGTGESTIVGFRLDTKNPEIDSFSVDSSTVDANKTNDNTEDLVISTTEDNQTGYQMRFSNNGTDWTSWEDYAVSKSQWNITDATYGGTSDDGTKTAYAQFRDASGNTSTTATDTILYDTTSPGIPSGMKAQDATNDNITPITNRIFVSWEVNGNLDNDFSQYHLYRGSTVSGTNDSGQVSDWSEIIYDESNDNLINYYVDENVDENHRYYYRLTTEDNIENVSTYGSIDSTIPDGSGGSGITSTPHITNLAVSDKGVGWVKITWDTNDVASDAKVYYSIGAINEGTNSSVTVATMGENHEVVITGLDANTAYNFRAKSANLDGNSDTDDISETTSNGAQISGVTIPELYNSQVSVRWSVSESPTVAKVYYTDQVSGGLPDFSTPSDKNATCDGDTLVCQSDITELTANTKYYFYVETDDDTDKNPDRGVIRYYNFLTGNDLAAPVITPNDAVFGAPVMKTDTKAVIKWITDEKSISRVLYKEEGDSYNDPNWSDVYTIERAVVLDSLSRNTSYTYKIQTKDINGNQSESDEYTFSTLSEQEDHPDLIASGDPTSANVLLVSESEAVIYFTTNTSSTAKLCYDTDQIADVDNCSDNLNSDTASITHVFHIDELSGGQTYYYRIKTTDSVNEDISFTTSDSSSIKFVTSSLSDVAAPGLSTYAISDTSSDSASISVVSDDNSIVSIYYSDNTDDFASGDYEEKSSSKSFGTTHSIELKNLSQGRTYYFKIKLQDENGNYNLYDNSGVYYTFETTSGPDISDGPDCSPGNNQLTISWDTDENADAYVIYSEEEDLTDYFKKGESEREENHSVTIGSLLPQITYYYQVISQNAAGGISASDTEECTTLGEGVDSEAPNISNAQAVLIGKNQALVNWTTDEVATSKVRYGKTESYSDTTAENTDMVVNHNVLLEDLDSGTSYHFQVVSKDASDNSDESSDYTFKTLGEATEDTDLSGFIGGAYTAPDISSASASVSKTQSNSATISWKTDKESTSLVVYKPDGGNYKDQGDTSTFVTNHEVTLNDLSPNTKYTFYVKSADSLGNSGQSNTDTFTTAAVSDIFNVEVIDVSYDGATISWETSANTTSQLEYGKTGEMDKDITKDSEKSKAHAINLTSLDAGTKYYFRIKGEDSSANIYSSSEYTFTTPAPPEVQDFKVDSISEHDIKVSFKTNIETDAFITLTNSNKEDEQYFQGSPEQKTEHSLEVGNLESGATYKLSVKVRDKEGNTTEKEIDDYTTSKDENAPVIENLRTTSALSQGGKVQTILSWDTDEPTKTIFIYREGISGNKREVTVDENYTVKHTAVITTLEQGTAYYFNVKAIDKADNVSMTQDRGVLTPKDRKNIIQVITNNFQNIFSWTSNIGL